LPYVLPIRLFDHHEQHHWSIGLEVTLSVLASPDINTRPSASCLLGQPAPALVAGIWWWIFFPVLLVVITFIRALPAAVSMKRVHRPAAAARPGPAVLSEPSHRVGPRALLPDLRFRPSEREVRAVDDISPRIAPTRFYGSPGERAVARPP